MDYLHAQCGAGGIFTAPGYRDFPEIHVIYGYYSYDTVPVSV